MFFSAMFSHYWLTRGLPATTAAELASRQVADYASTRLLRRPAYPPEMEAAPVRSSFPRVMMVADTDTTAGLWLAAEAAEALADLGVVEVHSHSAHSVGGMVDALACGYDVILSLPRTVGGAAVEAAFCARAIGIPCVAFAEIPELADELANAGAAVVSDFAACIYSVIWAGP